MISSGLFRAVVVLAVMVADSPANTGRELLRYGGEAFSELAEFKIPFTGTKCNATELSPGRGYKALPTEMKLVPKGNGLMVLMAAPDTGETSAESAVKAGHYLQFTLGADNGKRFDIMGFSSRVWSSSNGKRKFSVYITPRGGSSSEETVAIIEGHDVPTSSALLENPELARVEANLADRSAFRGIDGLEVKLIFHGFGSNPDGDASRSGSCIDEIILTGTVR